MQQPQPQNRSAMKTYPSHLLLLKGEDRTEEIANFKYEKGRPFAFRSKASGARPLTVYRTVAGNHARDHLNERQTVALQKRL